MTTLQPGQVFPSIDVATLDGATVSLSTPVADNDWKMVIVYRGKHCPLCTRYLDELNEKLPQFNQLGVDVIALSADSKSNAQAQLADINPNYPVGYGLTIEQMRALGLFISEPSLGTAVEAPFAEPALFVINQDGCLQMLDISNVPFARPNLSSMLMGIKFIRSREKAFAINGSFQG